jgi:hypothetical protein
LNIWFGRLLRDAFALEISGVYKSFAEVGIASLEALSSEQGVNQTDYKLKKQSKRLPIFRRTPMWRPVFGC